MSDPRIEFAQLILNFAGCEPTIEDNPICLGANKILKVNKEFFECIPTIVKKRLGLRSHTLPTMSYSS